MHGATIKILKPIYVFPSLLENSKPTLSSQRLRFTGKSSRVHTASDAGRQPGLSCREMFQGKYFSSTFQSLAIALLTSGINTQQFHIVLTLSLCVLCGSQNKQRLLPYTTLADWFCITEVECLLRGTDWVLI
jgi:hypothetical protein